MMILRPIKVQLLLKDAAIAQVEAADAAIVTAQEEVAGAKSSVEANKGSVARIQADIKDSALKTPRDGRVQYRVAQAGEVVAAGSPVLSLVDLSDVYMTFFLPTAYAGKVSIGEEVRMILDAAPQLCHSSIHIVYFRCRSVYPKNSGNSYGKRKTDVSNKSSDS